MLTCVDCRADVSLQCLSFPVTQLFLLVLIPLQRLEYWYGIVLPYATLLGLCWGSEAASLDKRQRLYVAAWRQIPSVRASLDSYFPRRIRETFAFDHTETCTSTCKINNCNLQLSHVQRTPRPSTPTPRHQQPPLQSLAAVAIHNFVLATKTDDRNFLLDNYSLIITDLRFLFLN